MTERSATTPTRRVGGGTADFLRGSGLVLAGKVAQVVAGYVVVVVALRYGSAEVFGVYSAAGAAAIVVASVGAGALVEIVLRFAGDVSGWDILRRFVLSRRGVLLALAVVGVLFGISAGIFVVADDTVADPAVTALVVSAYGVWLVAAAVLEAFAQRFSMFSEIAVFQILRSSLLVAVVAGSFLLSTGTVLWLFGAHLVAQLGACGYLAWRLARAGHLHVERRSGQAPDLDEYRSYARFGLEMLGGRVSSLVLQFADRVLLLLLVDAAAAGVYSATYDIFVRGPIVLMMAMFESTNGPIVQAWHDGHVARAFRELRRLGVAVMIVAGLSLVGTVVLYGVIDSLLDGQLESRRVAVVLVIGAGVWALGQVYQRVLRLTLRSRVVLMSALTSMALNLLLNVALIPEFGGAGAAIATLMSLGLGAAILVTAGYRAASRVFETW